MKKFILLLALVSLQVSAQDLEHYKSLVKELSALKYHGRGYARGGANKAGQFLKSEYERVGADEVSVQPFTLDIQTFSGKMKMEVRKDSRRPHFQTLLPGVDYSMREYSPGVKGEFPVYHVDTLNFDADKMFADLERPEYKNCMVCCEFWFTYRHRDAFARLQKAGECPNAGLLYTWPKPIKFFKAYGHQVVDKPIVWVTPEAIEGVNRVRLNVGAKFLKDYECFNVISKVEGERHDSCYVFTAHYDHVGSLGRHIFYPGANDNASGSAALVTLAAYYVQHRPKFDIYFLAFSGEDANLRGSTYFVEHPTFPLEKIKYLINIDMIGDNNPLEYCEVSDAGMKAFPLFEKINADQQYFDGLQRGKLEANSDHYVFATRGVPCIFLENKEGDAFQYYHTIFDSYGYAIFDSYEPTFRLVRDFLRQY